MFLHFPRFCAYFFTLNFERDDKYLARPNIFFAPPPRLCWGWLRPYDGVEYSNIWVRVLSKQFEPSTRIYCHKNDSSSITQKSVLEYEYLFEYSTPLRKSIVVITGFKFRYRTHLFVKVPYLDRRQRRDLFGLRVKLPSVTTSLTTQR